jgi:hypothetical protein
MFNVPADILPDGVAEGQMLRVVHLPGQESTPLSVTVDEAATKRAVRHSKAITQRAMDASKENDAGGDVSL